MEEFEISTQDAKFHQRCPRCHAHYIYFSSKINSNGQVRCQNCAQLMNVGEESLDPIDNLQYQIEESRHKSLNVVVLVVIFIFIILLALLFTVELLPYLPSGFHVMWD